MKRFLCFLCCLLFFSSLGQAQDTSKDQQKERAFGPLHKSLLIPGWGQLDEKQYLKGIVFVSAEIFCLVNVFTNNHKGNKNYRLYQDAGNVDDAVYYRDLTEKFDRRRNAYILAAMGVWALNLVDIYFTVQNREKEKSQVIFKFQSGSLGRMTVSLNIRF